MHVLQYQTAARVRLGTYSCVGKKKSVQHQKFHGGIYCDWAELHKQKTPLVVRGFGINVSKKTKASGPRIHRDCDRDISYVNRLIGAGGIHVMP